MKTTAELSVRKTLWDLLLEDCAIRGIHIPTGPVVYFIEGVGTGLVKIGKTGNLKYRWIQLRNGTPHQLKVLRLFEGYTREEAWAHDRFNEHRAKGEWFHLPQVMAAVEGLKALGSLDLSRSAHKEVAGACGCIKLSTIKQANKAARTMCASCAHKARFAAMPEEERRASIHGAREGYRSWLEANKDCVSRKVVHRLIRHKCPICGGDTVPKRKKSGEWYTTRTCAECKRSHWAKDEVGKVYGELKVTGEAGRNARGGIVLELVCCRGHVTSRNATVLRRSSRHNNVVVCPQCPHDADYWAQWNTLECNTKR
jgi:ssDNA-binding Zn-finger/Zn-ribbon topoisomerase 1